MWQITHLRKILKKAYVIGRKPQISPTLLSFYFRGFTGYYLYELNAQLPKRRPTLELLAVEVIMLFKNWGR